MSDSIIRFIGDLYVNEAESGGVYAGFLTLRCTSHAHTLLITENCSKISSVTALYICMTMCSIDFTNEGHCVCSS